MSEKSASEQIDGIIAMHPGWKADILTQLRSIVTSADANIFEEVKWKMRSRPEGLPVWSCNGIVCYTEILKDNIKLMFAKGSQLNDTKKLFNARLKSSAVRAVEIHEGDKLDKAGLTNLVNQAVGLNKKK